MIKSKPCKICSKDGHTASFCFQRPRKAAKKHEPLPRTRKPTRASLKKEAWRVFSIYIRTRDCLKTTGTTERGTCITCNEMKLFKQLQAGHFVGGRGNAVLFHEEIVNAQCGYCNRKPPMGLGGNYAQYTLVMIDRHGREKTEEFLNLRHSTKKYSPVDLTEVIETYKRKTQALLDKTLDKAQAVC